MAIPRLIKWFYNVPPYFIDGALYCALAIFQFLQIQLASDEAGKFIEFKHLWYYKSIVGATAAGLLAIKLFRSTQYASHIDQQKADVTGEPQITKPIPANQSALEESKPKADG